MVIRAGDTYEGLARKVELATILGTLQATLTDFRYLTRKWHDNTAEERLLGVSLTGIMDHKVLSGSISRDNWKEIARSMWGEGDYAKDVEWVDLEQILESLKNVAIETNVKWADELGIPRATAITCVKPSGTVSQLVDSSSGIHPRYSRYYIRTVRGDKKDPISQYMVDAGFPYEPDVTKPDSTYVFSFPMEAPKDAVFRDDRSAIEQLEHWLLYQRHWCEHKPSVTIYVKDEEWMEVGAWVYKHFDEMSGVSFLPYDGGVYPQMPYQEITEGEYNEWLQKMPQDVDWSLLAQYEGEDMTEGSQTLACVGGSCEI